MKFELEKTKVDGVTDKFDLSDPGQRRIYFKKKAGEEIRKIREYLDERTFVAIMLGKKGSGKGTYVGLFRELFGEDKVGTVSVGDVTRAGV